MPVSKLLAMIACLLLKFLVASADPCKLFPRILGSSIGTTEIYSIDANLKADWLVATGSTNDANLIGKAVTFPVPFITMYKISTTKIYYGISDLSSEGYYGFRVNFTPNAQFFVALTILDTSHLYKIQVFETSTGNLISSTTYLSA